MNQQFSAAVPLGLRLNSNLLATSYVSLFVLACTSSETITPEGERRVVGAEDYLLATPVLELSFSGSHSDIDVVRKLRYAEVQASHVGALKTTDPVFFPQTLEHSKKARYSIKNNRLQIKSVDIWHEPYYEVSKWFANLLKTSGTLGIVIYCEEDVYVTTLCEENVEPSLSVALSHKGTLNSRNTNNIVERSRNWIAGIVGNRSLLVGSENLDDTRSVTHGVLDGRQMLPRSRVLEKCVLCGTTAGMTTEHATPAWLADMLKVTPVTGRFLCSICNGRLGKELEAPMQKWYLSRTRPTIIQQQTINLWCFKTALFLAHASGMPIPNETFSALKESRIPKGFQVFFDRLPETTNGYLYTTTYFPQAVRRKNAFLLLFNIGDLVVVVFSHPDRAIYKLPGVDQTHPRYVKASPAASLFASEMTLHQYIIEVIIGTSMTYKDGELKPMSPRF